MKPLLIKAAKWLLKMAMDAAMRKALPRIYQALDGDIPDLLEMKAGPDVIESVVAHSIKQATGTRATATQIEAVIGLYDPIQAAIRSVKR
jgi:hypothetical protein